MSFAAARKRKLLAAAAAAGVSVAFGSPLGGVLFGLEELDAFSNDSDVMWRAFVTSVIAAWQQLSEARMGRMPGREVRDFVEHASMEIRE